MLRLFKRLMYLILPFLIISCNKNIKEKEDVYLKNEYGYYRKLYVTDKLGYTHEILTSSSGNRLGGVGMLELCVYKDGETDRKPEE